MQEKGWNLAPLGPLREAATLCASDDDVVGSCQGSMFFSIGMTSPLY